MDIAEQRGTYPNDKKGPAIGKSKPYLNKLKLHCIIKMLNFHKSKKNDNSKKYLAKGCAKRAFNSDNCFKDRYLHQGDLTGRDKAQPNYLAGSFLAECNLIKNHVIHAVTPEKKDISTLPFEEC